MWGIVLSLIVLPLPLIIGLIVATRSKTDGAKDYLTVTFGIMLWVMVLVLWIDFVIRIGLLIK